MKWLKASPILNKRETEIFLDKISLGLKTPARPIPTPNLHKVKELILIKKESF